MTSPFEQWRRQHRGKVAFVLGGGGNLGAVQVGMLQALVERGITADLVLGCSVGALNGAAYADLPTAGGVERLRQVWGQLDGVALMPGGWLPNVVQLARRGDALHDNANLRRLIERTLHARRFEDLALPFECVATDIDETDECWFDSGSLTERILASAALPGVYPIVTIDGQRYTDGGVVNDIPISRALEHDARTIFVLHVGHYDREPLTPTRPYEVALLAYWIVRRHRYRGDVARLPANVDLVSLPAGEMPAVGYDDFSRSLELIDTARTVAGAHLDEWVDRRLADRVDRPGSRLHVGD